MLHANKLSPTLISRAIPAVDIPLSLLFVVKPVTYAPRVEKMLRSSRSPKFLDVNVTEYRSDGTECSGCWGVDEAVDEGEGEGESDEDLDLLRSMVLLNEVRNRLNRLPLILLYTLGYHTL